MTSESDIFALMGRMHVILRKTLGRITDVDYMYRHPDYAREILDLAYHTNHHELVQLAEQLEPLMFGTHGLFLASDRRPLLERLRQRNGRPAPSYPFGLQGR